MKNDALLIRVIAWLAGILVMIAAGSVSWMVGEVRTIKETQINCQENQVLLMYKVGVDREDIEKSKENIEEIQDEMNGKR